MTSKTSLFNFGIFKTTIRRFIWGAAAYFAILFMGTCFPILLEEEYSLYAGYRFSSQPLLLSGEYIFFPAMASLAVPLVVSLLIFRFLHSKNQNIFTHSIPVSRGANYFSSVLAGLALMAAPVVLNGFSLFVIHFSYSSVIRIYHCFLWTAAMLFIVFVMFAAGALASVMTGNSFMAAFLYGFINLLPVIISGIVYAVGMFFVSGFPDQSPVIDFVTRYTPIIWIMNNISYIYDAENFIPIISYLAAAVLLYVAAYALYRVRKSEKTGDVAAFNCINPILKYLITTGAAILMYAVVTDNYHMNTFARAAFIMLASAIAYFACEMILKKTVKVFKSYKGCIGFWIVSAAAVTAIYFTGFFGYSYKIPDADDVESVAVNTDYNRYQSSDAVSKDPKAVEYVTTLHNKLAGTHRDFKNSNYSYYSNVEIKYNLKNGRVLNRVYSIPESKEHDVAKEMYSFPDYKKSYNVPLSLDADKVESMYIYYYNHDATDFDFNLTSKKDIREFLNVLKAETDSLTFDEVFGYGNYGADEVINVDVDVKKDPELKENDFDTLSYCHFTVSKNHKKTIEWINRWREENK